MRIDQLHIYVTISTSFARTPPPARHGGEAKELLYMVTIGGDCELSALGKNPLFIRHYPKIMTKKTLTTVFALSIAALALQPTLAHANWLTKETFKEVEGGTPLELHIAYPPNHKASDQSPAIVFFFGGGWKQGKPGQFYPFIQDLAKEGIVSISAQYRTKSSHGASPVDCVKDGKSAIRYIREHAAEMGIDPDKIIAGGGSAGGHVAACTAIDTAPEETDENREISSRPQALVLLNPVLSVGPDGYAHGYVRQFIEDWENLSPLHQDGSNFPPTLVQVGTEDKILPTEMAEEFEEKLTAAGTEIEIVFYEGASHGFFNKPEYRSMIVGKIKEFLRSLGYIQ